jgi:hypothetical protein
MSVVVVLFALSALIGFALGKSFSFFAIGAASIGVAVVSTATLEMHGFGAASGIAIVVACMTLSQAAYLAATCSRQELFDKKTDKEPRDRRGNNVAGKHGEKQKAPSWFA